MIDEIINYWEQAKPNIEERIRATRQEEYCSYIDLFKIVLEEMNKCVEQDGCYYFFDIKRLTCLDFGDYQGTLILVVPTTMYQPSVSDTLFTSVYYGSCSGCDTLMGISHYEDELPSEEQVKDYMTLCLHMVQRLKQFENSEYREGIFK